MKIWKQVLSKRKTRQWNNTQLDDTQEFKSTTYFCKHSILTIPSDLSTQNHTTSTQGHPYTKFEHFGIIHFWVMLQTK